MEQSEVEKYKNYPEGSPHKKSYDFYYLSFQDYLDKYYEVPDLSQWHYITSKFVTPLFDGTSWADYWIFLNQAKPKFSPVESKKNEFWLQIKDDVRFSIDLKHFFAFLYSIGFYRELSFEDWLNVNNWMHPWYVDENKNVKTITEIIKFNYGDNFLKACLSGLSIF